MGKKNDPKVMAYAAWMKTHGIRRTTAKCPVCYRTMSIPSDYHFRPGGGCK